MKMNDEKKLPVSQALAWQALNDIALLKACIPGCESIAVKPDGSYAVLIAAAVGPVKAKFKGEMRMKHVTVPTAYTLEFNGQGGAVGYCRGEAKVALSPVGADASLLQYTATASVGGKLAQVGARLIDMAAQKMAADFFGAFLSELTTRHPPATVAIAHSEDTREPSEGLWSRFVAWIANFLGKRRLHSPGEMVKR